MWKCILWGSVRNCKSTLLLFYVCKYFTNPVMKENSFISLGQESDCLVWIRWNKHKGKVGIYGHLQCPQMPTNAHKIGHFQWRFLCNFMELFAWTVCYGWGSKCSIYSPQFSAHPDCQSLHEIISDCLALECTKNQLWKSNLCSFVTPFF